ncbi:MAG: methyltransferase [Deltaproteobacteria bacterium]|nr:methyltransferase [Deltaproteobacteria bacterium]
MLYRLTPGLVLRSPWRPYFPRGGERVLVVKAPQVFPPSHPTTRLCLELLTETLSGNSHAWVLDVGCGSGILALAAAALGAPFCVGVDLNRQAAEVSRDNAWLNGLADRLRVVQGSTEAIKVKFRLLVANLPVKVQLEKVEELTRLAGPGASLILSGFRDTQEEELRCAYEAAGWRSRRRLTVDEWAIELPPEGSFTWAAWLLVRED